jgi:hypothetical protein
MNSAPGLFWPLLSCASLCCSPSLCNAVLYCPGQKSIGKHKTAQDSTREYRTVQESTGQHRPVRQHTAKTQHRKLETNIPRKGTARPQFPFLHSFFCERFIHSHDRYALFCCRKIVGPVVGYIKRSQTHECGNWDGGRAIPFLGRHKSKCLCSAQITVPANKYYVFI